MATSKYPPPQLAIDVHVHPKQTGYPEPFRSMVKGRIKRRLSEVFGLSNFGVNLTLLEPGSISSIRHNHTKQDEFVYILEGAPTLVTDAGSTQLEPGMCAGFKAGIDDAHHLRNDTGEDVWFLEVGDRTAGDMPAYPDEDLAARVVDGIYIYTHKNGTPYE